MAQKPESKRNRVKENEDGCSFKKRCLSPDSSQHSIASFREELRNSQVSRQDSGTSDAWSDHTATPVCGPSGSLQFNSFDKHTELNEHACPSPLEDTQAFSQERSLEPLNLNGVNDEGIWGYLLSLDENYEKTLILRKQAISHIKENSVSNTTDNQNKVLSPKEEAAILKKAIEGGATTGRYLIGRHPECDLIIPDPKVSNRHALIFMENNKDATTVLLEDLSSNGTFVNGSFVGRNKTRELKDRDEITVTDSARFVFRESKPHDNRGFLERYTLLEKLGEGYFAEVFRCVDKLTGQRFAVKIFTNQGLKASTLHHEVAVLMSMRHSNILSLINVFNESSGVYLVMELAHKGELFDWIIKKEKLNESETRKIFVQLFNGVKYLHERGIVHRDIKPENILLTGEGPTVKLADFGLAKIVGEQSFATSICGTLNYIAPEILEKSGGNPSYSHLVDVWSLGVVLYICLCGFPPFSNELYSEKNPYTVTEQITLGRFDYPSPYWDSIGDSALDLIDRMLTVDVQKRYNIDDCLNHPWITEKVIGLNDSTASIAGGMSNLDFSKRKIKHERTLLSNTDRVKVACSYNFEMDNTITKKKKESSLDITGD